MAKLRSRVTLLIFVFFLCSSVTTVLAASVPEIIAKVEPAVGIVRGYDNRGQEISIGTGFIISQAGEFITNRHVIENASYVEIELSNGKKVGIKRILGVRGNIDLVKMQLDTQALLPYLTITDKLPVKGEEVLAIGNPTGLKFVVSNGIVSAIQSLQEISSGQLIQFTAPVSPGSSGGPLINLQGEVIGIVTLTKVTGQNLNFAIPSSNILNLVDPTSEPNVNINLQQQKQNTVENKREKPVIAITIFGNGRIWKINKASEIIDNTIDNKVKAANYYKEYSTASLRRNLKEFFDGMVKPNEDVNLANFSRELISKFGRKYGYDYVLAITIELDNPDTLSSGQIVNVAMTTKLLDVKADKYLFFDIIREVGKHHNFWTGGLLDNAIIDGISKAMKSFDNQVILPAYYEFKLKSTY